MSDHAVPTPSLAEPSIPSLAGVRRDGRVGIEAPEDLSWAEESVSRWRALSLLGTLAVSEGLYFTFVEAGGGQFLILGAVLFFAAVLLAAAGASEYGWAVLAAAVLGAGIAATAYRGAVLSKWPEARFSGGIVPANGTAAVEIGLILGGAVIAALGLVASLRPGRPSSRE